ncbi:hypothetical protein BA177_02925 [Woeseia oceani]|uniref:Uncharacterized protein n=1 Tax=Woeseia oceani TaxID=1548547 RepID=A0A193LCX0_9GAMM|nr:hypothetical protein BA177_02925 [Woeseia oceani]
MSGQASLCSGLARYATPGGGWFGHVLLRLPLFLRRSFEAASAWLEDTTTLILPAPSSIVRHLGR